MKRAVAPVETLVLTFMLLCLKIWRFTNPGGAAGKWQRVNLYMPPTTHLPSKAVNGVASILLQSKTQPLLWSDEGFLTAAWNPVIVQFCSSCTVTVQKGDAWENWMWGWLLTAASFCISAYFCPSHWTRYYSPGLPINDSHCLIKKWKEKGQESILQKNLCIWSVRSLSGASP